MKKSKRNKAQKRQQALQRQQHATTRRPVTQIPPENADQVAMTTTGQDMIRDMLRQGESPTGYPRRVVQEQLSGETPLTTQLAALMRSEAYEDWLHAGELLRDHTPDYITTFAALERLFHLDVQDCSVPEMLYELDMALHNEGLEDAPLTATRAEVARWVYTHFTEESALNLENFRGGSSPRNRGEVSL